MKKYYVSFLTFIIAFVASLAFIYFKANPSNKFSEDQNLSEWHGQVDNSYGTYDGTLIGDMFSGKGSFRFLSGEIYVGEWKKSYMSGDGEVIFPGIGTYKGQMNDSKRNGKGTFTWDSSDEYVGDWENDAMCGNGKYTFSNGIVFEGVMENNKPVSGILTYKVESEEGLSADKLTSFEYNFSDDEKHIKFTTKGGLIYDGDVSGVDDVGRANITYPSGNTYSGQLSHGKREGSGKYTWVDKNGKTKTIYNGEWKSDLMEGKGKYYYTSSDYPYLSGNFVKGKPNGTLIYYKEADNTFDTVWENGVCQSVKES